MVAHAQPLRKETWEQSVQLAVAQCNNPLAHVEHHLHKTCTRSASGVRRTCTCPNTLRSNRLLDDMQHEETHLISICTLPSMHLLGEEETFYRLREEARVAFCWSALPSSPSRRAQEVVLEEVV